MPDKTRRALLAAVPVVMLPGVARAELLATPPAAEGPFYPVALPSDHDSDLVRLERSILEAGGQILRLGGTLRDRAGSPIQDGIVEIWQCDLNGVYLHPGSRGYADFDQAFQGFGRAATDADGHFSFRTIVPAPYPGRTPHIHLKAYAGGRERLTTQYYLADHPMNVRDGLFNRMSPAEQARQSMMVASWPEGSTAQYRTEIDIVVDV